MSVVGYNGEVDGRLILAIPKHMVDPLFNFLSKPPQEYFIPKKIVYNLPFSHNAIPEQSFIPSIYFYRTESHCAGMKEEDHRRILESYTCRDAIFI